YEDPRGQSVRLGTDYYTVVGVVGQRATSSKVEGSGSLSGGQDFNRDVYIPLNTGKLRFGERIISSRAGTMEAEETQLTQITIQVHTIEQVQPSAPIIEAAVKNFHQKIDYEMIVPYDLLLEAQRTARQFSIILGTIASISLLVGGIGIMN